MSLPNDGMMENSVFENSIEEVQNILDIQFPDSYFVYNLSPHPYTSESWFHNRTLHWPMDKHKVLTLNSLINLCKKVYTWLIKSPEHICVIHCTDGKAASAILACSLICFCRLFDNASPAIQLFSSRRGNPNLNASQIRYI